jgi:hypothetical protein
MPVFKLAAPQRHESLTLFPIVDEEGRDPPYTLLADALEAETLRITEVGSGSVPELRVENAGDTDVLILDGEQLIGAKQNRMTNRTILLAAQTKTTIPVSCMEHGRWHFTSREFRHASHYSPSKVRRHNRKMEAAYAVAEMEASPQALAQAQGDVWNEIADYSAKMGGRSGTGALDHLYEMKSLDLDEWSKSFPWVDDQIGLLAFLGDKPLGMDVIGGYKLYARLHKRLVSGYIMDAISERRCGGKSEIGEEAARRFLDQVEAATRTRAPTVGRGTYKVLSGDVMGGELEYRSRLAHLSAFPLDEESRSGRGQPDEQPVAPPSRRRRWSH